MHQRRVKPAAQQPYNIKEYGKAARICWTAYHFLAKGPQYQACQFKTLQAPGYAYYSNAKQYAAEKITQRCKKTAEDEPDEVAGEVQFGFVYCRMKIQ